MARSKTPPPSIEEAIGRVSMAWSALEVGLTVLLTELLQTDSATGMIASAALDYRHRRDLITSLSAVKLNGSPLLAQITAFMGDVKGMAKERNEAIHSLNALHPETGRQVKFIARNQGIAEFRFKDNSPRHLASVAHKILVLSNQAIALAGAVRVPTRAWLEKFPPPPFPHQEIGEHHAAANPDKP